MLNIIIIDAHNTLFLFAGLGVLVDANYVHVAN